MDFITIAKDFLENVSKKLQKYTSKPNIVTTEGESKVILETPAHIQFARYGRAPGKMPPIDSILEFVKSKNIMFDGSTQKGTAFAIAKSISQKGTKNWVPNAPNFLEESLEESLAEYSKELSDLIAIETDQDVQNIYIKSIPKKQIFKA